MLVATTSGWFGTRTEATERRGAGGRCGGDAAHQDGGRKTMKKRRKIHEARNFRDDATRHSRQKQGRKDQNTVSHGLRRKWKLIER